MSIQATASAASILARTIGFTLGLTLLFTLVAHMMPQMEGEAPSEQALDVSGLTLDEFVAWGEDLFNNKGTCSLCHKPPPLGRAPDLQGEDMVMLAARRVAEEGYRGEATEVVSYLRESMVDPTKYVTAGWGKKGSNDMESPMPAVDKQPIQLSDSEMDAIIAYLQAKDGYPVTVALPVAAPVGTTIPVAATEPSAPAATSAREALEKYACTSCHALESNERRLGPGLFDLGSRLTLEQIRQSVLEPNAVITEGYPPVMPTDFAEKMTIRELEMIVQYLAGQR